MDSGPFGILALDATIVDNNVADNINASSSPNCSEKSNTENVGRFEECANGSLNPNTVITTAAVTSEVAMPTTAERIERANETGLFITKQPQICLSTASAEKTLADVVKLHRPSGVTRIAEQENEWTLVQRRQRQRRPRVVGQKGIANDSESKFTAVAFKIPIFITNISKQTKESDITDYVYKATNERINLEKIITKKEKPHDAYKFYVTEDKVPLFLDCNLWPKGIIFRRFLNFKRPSEGSSNTASGTVTNT